MPPSPWGANWLDKGIPLRCVLSSKLIIGNPANGLLGSCCASANGDIVALGAAWLTDSGTPLIDGAGLVMLPIGLFPNGFIKFIIIGAELFWTGTTRSPT